MMYFRRDFFESVKSFENDRDAVADAVTPCVYRPGEEPPPEFKMVMLQPGSLSYLCTFCGRTLRTSRNR
jgi:hypothetical protein